MLKPLNGKYKWYTILYCNHIVRYIIVLVIPIVMYTVSNIIILHNNILCRYLYIIIIYKITRIRMTKRFPLFFKRNPILWFRKCIFSYLGLIAVTDTADQNWVDEKKNFYNWIFYVQKVFRTLPISVYARSKYIYTQYILLRTRAHTYIHSHKYTKSSIRRDRINV